MMTDSNGSNTPRERPARKCPDEISDLFDFMARLIVLVVAIVGPALLIGWLALGSLLEGGSYHQGMAVVTGLAR